MVLVNVVYLLQKKIKEEWEERQKKEQEEEEERRKKKEKQVIWNHDRGQIYPVSFKGLLKVAIVFVCLSVTLGSPCH